MKKSVLKKLISLAGVATMALGLPAHAQNVLSAYSQVESAAATTASYDYRYTRHSIGGSGRGGGYHSTISYTWDPYLDQTTSQALPLNAAGVAQVSTQGTFYAPTYGASVSASSSLTNTPQRAILTVNYAAGTTVTTPLGAHQAVTVTAQPGGTFTFTVSVESDVTVTTFGDPGGVFRLSGYGTLLFGPLSGTGGPVSLDTPLAPGTYSVTDSLTYAAGLNTQSGTSTNPGATSTAWGFTMTVTPTEVGSSGGGSGSGGQGSGSGSDD